MRNKSELKKATARVNQVLKAEARVLGLGTKSSLERLEQCKNDMPAFSKWAELEFREYVRRQLEKHTCTSIVLINGGARLLGLSPATTKRYLGKLRVEGGPFGGLGDVVILNPRYVPKEEDDYWLSEEPPAEEDKDA